MKSEFISRAFPWFGWNWRWWNIKAESGRWCVAPTMTLKAILEGGFPEPCLKFLDGGEILSDAARQPRLGDLLLRRCPAKLSFELDGVNEYMVQKDGFLAGADAIVIESKMQSLSRGLLGGEGFFILKISGKGTLALNSFGAIHKIELKPDQEYIVDNSHLVAWSSTTSYNIEKATSEGSQLHLRRGIVSVPRARTRLYSSRNQAVLESGYGNSSRQRVRGCGIWG